MLERIHTLNLSNEELIKKCEEQKDQPSNAYLVKELLKLAETNRKTLKFNCYACMTDEAVDGCIPKCGHMICSPCKEQMIKYSHLPRNQSCPLCRQPLEWLV